MGSSIGLQLRRQTDGIRQGLTQLFYRGEAQPSPIIEVVAPSSPSPDGGATTLWGITFVCSDSDRSHKLLEGHTKPPWKAVQSGRGITTLQDRDSLGISIAVAFMSPHQKKMRSTDDDAKEVTQPENQQNPSDSGGTAKPEGNGVSKL